MKDKSVIKDPINLEERNGAAKQCVLAFKFPFTTVVDGMDDAVAVRWAAWPDRIFMLNKERKVIYAGKQGPFGFKPSIKTAPEGGSLEAFLKEYFN